MEGCGVVTTTAVWYTSCGRCGRTIEAVAYDGEVAGLVCPECWPDAAVALRGDDSGITAEVTQDPPPWRLTQDGG